MGFFDTMEKAVTETGQGISRKAKELAEVTRLKNMLHTCEEVMDQNYREIGRAYYEAHKDKPDNEYARQCKAIADAQKGAEALREQLANVGSQETQ